MAAEQTTRFSIYTWSSDGDVFTRSQMTTSNTNIETYAAKFITGSGAPSGGVIAASNARTFYYDTTGGILYYSNTGLVWFEMNTFGTPSGTLAPGGSNSAGVATTAARSDHTHAITGYSASATSVSTATAAGSASSISRGDHTHNLGAGSVTAGTIASGAINNSNLFAAGVVNTAAIGAGEVTRSNIEVSERIPVGTIVPYAGTAAPTGWLLCNGQSVSPSSDLGVVLGGRFGTDGGNYRVPDLQTRIPLGLSTMGATAPASGGNSTVTLSTGNLPAHSHAATGITIDSHAAHSHTYSTTTGLHDLSHTHDIGHDHADSSTGTDGIHAHTIRSTQSTAIAGSGASVAMSGGSFSSAYIANSSAHSHTVNVTPFVGSSLAASATMNHSHSVSGTTANNAAQAHAISGSTAETGSGTAVNILPPYWTMNYIIKT